MSSYQPDGYTSLTPYVLVRQAEAFGDFLRDVFGAEILRMERHEGRIMHASARLDDAHIEWSAGNEIYPPMATALHYYVPDVDAVHARAVAAGCTVLHPPTDQPYGERSSGVVDPFGNHWYIATYTQAS